MSTYRFVRMMTGFVQCICDEGTPKERVYVIDAENLTCSCEGFYFRGYKGVEYRCAHLKDYLKSEEKKHQITHPVTQNCPEKEGTGDKNAKNDV